RLVNIGGGRERSGDWTAEIIDDHVMELDTSITGVANAVNNVNDGAGVHLESCLFAHLPDDGVFQPFAQLDDAARQAPRPLERLVPAFHEEHAVAVNDHRADADDRTVRKASHTPITFTTTRFRRSPSNSA